MQDIRQSHKSVDAAVAASVLPTSIIIGCMYSILTVAHLIMLEGATRVAMASLAVASTLVAFGVGWRFAKQGSGSLSPGLAITVLAIIVAVNTVVHFLLIPQIENTTNFVVMCLGLGLLLRSRRWFYTFQLLLLVTWIGIVQLHGITTLENYGWMYFLAFFVSATLLEQRLRAFQAVLRREERVVRRNRLLQKLVSAEEWQHRDLAATHQLICNTANEELGTDATSIWLIDRQNDVMSRTSTFIADKHRESFLRQPSSFSYSALAPILAALSARRVVAVPNIATSELAGREVKGTSADDFETTAALFCAIIVSGEIAGVVVNASLSGQVDWSAEDTAFSSSIADIAALAIQSHERALLEERANQVKRLESLGILAGGVAHDFNNLLTVVLGNAELIDLHIPASDRDIRPKIRSITEAGSRAKELSRQMLAYAGRASLQMQVTDLNALVVRLTNEARDALGRDLSLEFFLEERSLPVEVDATQIRQILMNLLSNAADAHADGVQITTGTRYLHELPDDAVVTVTSSDFAPGEFSWFEVSDNGEGMSVETQAKVFDPFFSTRSQGSGLGLAAVLGIIRALGGFIWLTSERGAGTTVRVSLPLTTKVPETVEAKTHLLAAPAAGTVLLIDDEQSLASYVQELLTDQGFTVVTFKNYLDFVERADTVDVNDLSLALIDLTLGDGRGTDIVPKLRQANERLPVVIMSGYDASDALDEFAGKDSVAFLQKPFQAAELFDSFQRANESLKQDASLEIESG